MTYETNSIYLPEERAAVALALAAGRVPNEATRAYFDALRPHFSEVGIVEIVNDTFASDLEAAPMDYASKILGPAGWNAGKQVA